jgi:hypothetical protein
MTENDPNNLEYCVFYYEKLHNRPELRDFRNRLRDAFCKIHSGKKLKDIPEVTEIILTYSWKYNMIFDKEEINKDLNMKSLFTKKRFLWMKNIEEFEHSVFEN